MIHYIDLYKDSIPAINSGDTVLFKRGSSKNIYATKGMDLTGLSDVTIGNYGFGSLPLFSNYTTLQQSDFVEVDSVNPLVNGVPNYKTETNLWLINKIGELAFPFLGTLGNFGEAVKAIDTETLGNVTLNNPSYINDDKRFVRFDLPNNPLGCIYSVGNPVSYYGTIYIVGNDFVEDLIRINGNSRNITIDGLHLKFGNNLVGTGTTSGKIDGLVVKNCVAEYSKRVCDLWSTVETLSNVIIENNIGSNLGYSFLQAKDYLRNVHIRDNTSISTGHVRSPGGIYIGNCFATKEEPVKIYRNHVVDHKYGRYWPGDGGAIYIDSQSYHVHIFSNLVEYSYIGFQNNSGWGPNYIYSNITNACDLSYVESSPADLKDTSGDSLYLCNNTFAWNTKSAYYYSQSDTEEASYRDAIISFNTASESTRKRFVYNNILLNNNTVAKTFGLISRPIAGADRYMEIYNNIVYGVLNETGWNDGAGTGTFADFISTVTGVTGGGNIGGWPGIDTDYKPDESSYKTGLLWWNRVIDNPASMSPSVQNLYPVDYTFRPLAHTPDIGAVQLNAGVELHRKTNPKKFKYSPPDTKHGNITLEDQYSFLVTEDGTPIGF